MKSPLFVSSSVLLFYSFLGVKPNPFPLFCGNRTFTVLVLVFLLFLLLVSNGSGSKSDREPFSESEMNYSGSTTCIARYEILFLLVIIFAVLLDLGFDVMYVLKNSVADALFLHLRHFFWLLNILGLVGSVTGLTSLAEYGPRPGSATLLTFFFVLVSAFLVLC